MTPEALIREAQKNFFFAFFQWTAMENGIFKYSNLPNKSSWTVEGETRVVEWTNQTEKGFQTQILNQLRAALAIAVIQTDTVLSDYYKSKGQPYQDTDQERRATRCIIYMIRCAFAHNPLEPKWEVKSDNYKDVFKVPSVRFTLDTRELHGKPFDDINWFRLLDLIEYCKNLVKGV